MATIRGVAKSWTRLKELRMQAHEAKGEKAWVLANAGLSLPQALSKALGALMSLGSQIKK